VAEEAGRNAGLSRRGSRAAAGLEVIVELTQHSRAEPEC
jgi:hypothetical protein